VKNMPPWKPGKQNGNPVKVYFKLPVTFKLGTE
jgi:protein TonB